MLVNPNGQRSGAVLLASMAVFLTAGVVPAQLGSGNPSGSNSTGAPGVWLDWIAHGGHGVGCNGTQHQFYPIHGALIPKGPYKGCVLVWEKGHMYECRTFNGANADADQRWAIFDPRTTPPTIHKLAWRINIADAPLPPCQNGPNTPPLGHQGLFCAGHCWLPDGRLLVAGGDYWFVGSTGSYTVCSAQTDFAGSRMLSVFDPNDIDVLQTYQQANGPGTGKPWRSLSTTTSGLPLPIPLREPRWYPSVTLMAPATLSAQQPSVYISIAGGIETFEPVVSVPSPGDPSYSTHELYRFDVFANSLSRDPRIGTTPTPQSGLFRGPTTPSAAGLSFLYYPRLHFMSARPGSLDGRLWMSGMAIQSSDGDVINAPEAWTNGAVLPSGWIGSGNTMIEEATVVLFPPINPTYRDVQMVIGGMKTTSQHGGTGTITNEVVFAPTRSNFGWVTAPGLGMEFPRKFANAVILPDASIVVVGGGTNPVHGSPGGEQFAAEMFKDGQWQTLSDQFSPRTYHSIALLLPDGTILSAGGDTHADGAEYEILVPPYLVGSPARPAIIGTPPTILHYSTDAAFEFTAPFGQTITSVALITPGSVTHSQDSNQRYEPLTFDVDDTGSLAVHSPTNPTQCPPGYYMMFLISSAGVPSVAHWVQVMP